MREVTEILGGDLTLFYAQTEAESNFVVSGRRAVYEEFLDRITPGQLALIREAQRCVVMATLSAAFDYFQGSEGQIMHLVIPETVLDGDNTTVAALLAEARQKSERVEAKERKNANDKQA